MLAPEYGAAEEKRKKEEEAEAFAAKMNAKYNNQEQERFEDRAQDKYNHQYNKHPERTQHPDFKKHLLTPKERAAKAAKKTLSALRKAASSTSSYIRRKAAERKAYVQSPQYKALQAKKKQERAKRKEAFNNQPHTSAAFSLFAPQPAARKPARPANNPMPSLFAPAPQHKSKRSKKPKNPGSMGGIIDSVPVIGGGFGGI